MRVYLQVGEALANHEIDGDDLVYQKTIRHGTVFFFERNPLACLLEIEYINYKNLNVGRTCL